MKKIHAALIAGFGLMLAGSLAAGGLHLYGTQPTLPANTAIAGWEVGGMNIAEVKAGMDSRLQALEATPLVMKAKNNAGLQVTLKQAGVTYEAGNFLQALKTLTDGTLMERVQARRSWSGSWNMEIQLQTAQLKSLLNPEWEKASFGVPVDAVRRITGDDQVVYTPGTSSYEVDWQALELAMQAAVPTRLAADGTLQDKQIQLEVPLAVKQPKITLQALKDQGIDRKIVQFSTSLGASGPGRSFNVEAAAKAVNGTVLPPNAVFDYGKAIQKAQTEYGFREAPVIVNGKLQPGTGGGSARSPAPCIMPRCAPGLRL